MGFHEKASKIGGCSHPNPVDFWKNSTRKKLEIALPMLLSWILAQGRGQPERGAKGKLGMIGPPEIFM